MFILKNEITLCTLGWIVLAMKYLEPVWGNITDLGLNILREEGREREGGGKEWKREESVREEEREVLSEREKESVRERKKCDFCHCN